jgi:PAS domain S-box-containing protein
MGMITIDEVGAIRDANEYVAQMFGHSMAELTAMNVAELMPRP